MLFFTNREMLIRMDALICCLITRKLVKIQKVFCKKSQSIDFKFTFGHTCTYTHENSEREGGEGKGGDGRRRDRERYRDVDNTTFK